MATYAIHYNPETRTAHVIPEGGDAPEDSIDIGEFEYEPGDIKVFFHHVRDALYHRKPDGAPGFWPENETDMQRIVILTPSEIVEPVAVSGVTLDPATASVEEGSTVQLTATVAPANASNPAVTFASNDEAVATVDGDGLVTGVLAGEATITVTTTDGNFTDTSVVTVTAPE